MMQITDGVCGRRGVDRTRSSDALEIVDVFDGGGSKKAGAGSEVHWCEDLCSECVLVSHECLFGEVAEVGGLVVW